MTRPLPREPLCVHKLVEQVATGPQGGQSAVLEGDERVSYRDLERLARDVADLVRAHDLPHGATVGVSGPRGSRSFAAMLGVMKAGLAYVPIDSTDPHERIQHVIATAGVRLVLTSAGEEGHWRSVQDAYSEGVAVSPIPFATLSTEIPSPDDDAVNDARRAAYVIFTSGSTGRPKGVAMAHSSLVNLFAWHDQARPGSCQSRTAQVCSTSFDFSVHEIFSTLCFGGTLVVADESARRNPFALVDVLGRLAVQRLFLPVTMLEQFAEAAERTQTSLELRDVVTTGERLRISGPLRQLFSRTGARLHNHYGATEFQDAATHTLSGDPDGWPQVVPVGQPITGVQLHILDERLVDVAAGEVGELCVGGAGLALGYVGDPDLTARRFVLGLDGAGRLYRTGDLARRRLDGDVELLGRADTQVKVGGVRVDCAAVETLLLEHPSLRAAAVVAHLVDERPRLVAHIVSAAPKRGDQADMASVWAHGTESHDRRDLHDHLARQLPDAALPEAYVDHPSLPLTSSGKTDRGRLQAPTWFNRLGSRPVRQPRSATERMLAEVWGSALKTKQVSVTDTFFDLGGTSLMLVQLHHELCRRLGRAIPPALFAQFPTIASLAAALDRGSSDRPAGHPASGAKPASSTRQATRESDIAVIGMSGRFPGASSIEELWSNLVSGVETVQPLTRPSHSDYPPNHVAMAGMLPGIDLFDAHFFGISPGDARVLDPQHRLFLECAWEAMEDAGYAPGSSVAGHVGVFGGAGISTYLVNELAPALGLSTDRPLTEFDLDQFRLKLGNDPSYLTTRVSHALNLSGPSVTVQTACSTSLVAVHLACRSLLAGESDIALAGGVHVVVPQETGYLHEPGMVLSKDGHTRAFDAEATGTLFGNGCGIVALKRLEDARRDNDRILAVIAGSAINNDGAQKLGFTAPSVGRQADVITDALAAAEVDPGSVAYVEAHGSGTPLGDSVELAALTTAYGSMSDADRRRALGSVKTNVGHLDEAAGVTGLIKAVLSVQRGTLPPSLNMSRPSPALLESPFRVVTEAEAWDNGDDPRIAGVSSLGVGGTNCHVLVREESSDVAPVRSSDGRPQLLCLSAKTPRALADLRDKYVAHFEENPDVGLADACFTSSMGRRHLPHRLTVVADSLVGATQSLRQSTPDDGAVAVQRPATAWLFPGQGPQHAGMTRELYERFPVFRAVLQECHELSRGMLDQPLLDLLFPVPGASSQIGETRYAQPTLFAVEVALAELWRSWGLEATVLLGHSHGEYAAAHAAGVLTTRDALTMVCARGRLMQGIAEAGAMVAVAAGEADVAPLLGARTAVAAVNGPHSVVISGPVDEVETAIGLLNARGVRHRTLEISQASHSPVMEPMLADFASIARSVSYRSPSLPIISTVTGAPVGEEMGDWKYWVDQLVRPVQFSQAVDALTSFDVGVVLELSPRPTLLPLLDSRDPTFEPLVVASTYPDRQVESLLEAAGTLWMAGVDLNWAEFHSTDAGRRVPLPTYPWQRQRHWVDAPSRGSDPTTDRRTTPPAPRVSTRTAGVLLGDRLNLAGATEEARFVTDLSPSTVPWLAEHRVFDTIVLPGVTHLEIAVEAQAALNPESPAHLRDVHILKPMEFADLDDQRQVQVVVTGSASHEQTFEIHSRSLPSGQMSELDSPWTLHAVGRLVPAQERTHQSEPADYDYVAVHGGPPAAGLTALKEKFRGGELSPQDVYDMESARRISLGEPFRVFQGLWRQDGEALSDVRLSDATHPTATQHLAHPLLLEAGLLTLTAAYPSAWAHRTFVPLGFDRVQIHALGQEAAWCHAKLREAGSDEPETLQADVTMMSAEGTPVLSMLGVRLRKATQATMFSTPSASTWRQWVHSTRWTPVAGLPEPQPPALNLHWVVFGTGSTANSFAQGARSLGVECTVISGDDAAAPKGVCGGEPITNADAWIMIAPQSREAAHADQGVATMAGTHRALALAQRLTSEAQAAPRLCLATVGAQAVDGGYVQDPAGSALWGLARVVAAEHPDVDVLQVDLDPLEDARIQAAQLLRELAAAGDLGEPLHTRERQVAYRHKQRYAARLRRRSSPPEPGLVRTDVTYLLTGGLGDLGLQAAAALVEAGARHLVLTGRTGRARGAAEALATMRADGVDIRTLASDVSDAGAVSTLVAQITSDVTLPPIGGVIHLAGLLDDGVLLLQTQDRLERVLSPKVRGAWNLHAATIDLPLDFFVLYSSSSGLLGTPGQASYAAANAYLDGLASYRRGKSLPAVAVQWGSWSDVGISARAGLDQGMRASGEGVISPDEGRAALVGLLSGSSGDGVSAVLPNDWSRWSPHHAASLRGILTDLRTTDTADLPDVKKGSMRGGLDGTPHDLRIPLLKTHVREKVHGVLGAGQDIPDDASLFDNGLDSLTAIVLRRDLQRSLGVELPPAVVFEYPTVTALSDHLLHTLAATGGRA